MPFQPILPTWLALNASNDTSASGFTDLRTQQPVNAGGLNLGDYFELTEAQANQLSYTATGLLHWGRYRRIQVDANATAANVAKGLAAYIVAGYSLQGVAILTAGSGQTAGSYTAAASGGGGSGAVITYVIATGGTLASAVVSSPGSGYTSTPTFTIAAGGSAGTVQAQMLQNPDILTDFAHAANANVQARAVFLSSITPGNFGFVQEAGLATVLANSSLTAAAIGNSANPKSGGAGTWDSVATAILSASGQWLDLPVVSSYGRIILNIADYTE